MDNTVTVSFSCQMIIGKNFPYSRDGGLGVEADLGFEFRGLRYKEEVSEVTEQRSH